MKQLIDLLIVLVFVVLIVVGGYVVYQRVPAVQERVDTLLNRTAQDEATSAGSSARVTASGLELPRLRQAELESLLPAPGDLPPGYELATTPGVYTADMGIAQQEAESEWPAAAARLAEIRARYGWHTGAGITFDTCGLNQDTGRLTVEVYQLTSTQAARAFIDDPLVRGYFRALSFAIAEVPNAHGFMLISRTPGDGACYPREWLHDLFVEQWGLLFKVQVTTNAIVPDTVGRALLESLPGPLLARLARLEALAEVTVPPTPLPVNDPLNVLTREVTLEDLQLLLPLASSLNLSASYMPDLEASVRYDLPGLVAFYRNANALALAEAIDVAGRRYGLIGQQIVVWQSSRQCPDDGPGRVEVDLMLFERAAGANAYLQDAAVQAARRSTGLYNEFVPAGEAVYGYGTVSSGGCGPLLLVEKSQAYERLLFSISFTAPPTMTRQEITALVDAMMERTLIDLYMQRLR